MTAARGEARPWTWWLTLIVAGAATGLASRHGWMPLAAAGAIVVVGSLLGAVAGHHRLGSRVRLTGTLTGPMVGLGAAFPLLAVGVVLTYQDRVIGLHRWGTAAMLLGLVALISGSAGLLNERLRDYAADIILESTVIAATLGVTAWLLLVEGRLDVATKTPAQLVAAVVVATLALVVTLASSHLGLGPGGTTTARLLFVGTGLVFAGVTIQLLQDVGVIVPTVVAAMAGLAGIGIIGAAAAHPDIAMLQTRETMAPVRLGLARLAVLIAAVLVVPAITGVRLLRHQDIALESVLVASAILSLAVIGYLAGLLREWSRIEHRTQHDELTGLPNRRHFHERLALEVVEAEDAEGQLAVMFLDLDRFKVVNDSLGHASGNQLLEAIAHRIADTVPPGALAARLQGDEFAILLPGATADGGESIEVANQVLAAIARPCQLQRRKLYVTASVGIAHYPADGADWESLLRSADTAMYQAKDHGRNNAQVHTPEMHMTAVGRLDLETALHGAIERGELSVVYQPKVELATGEVVGAEALVRWTHPELGPISPTEFIEIAEETGLIVPLGEWVLTTACEQAKRWQDAGLPDVLMAVNLSARQFQLTNVADLVARALRLTGADPALLELELTESLAVQNIARVSATLHDLVGMGVRCSIDDFGTGYSGLRYLASFPLHTVKVDKSFVWGIDDPSNPTDHAPIVQAIIAMAKGLGMRVCAEGVETSEQMYFLMREGCDEIQGQLFSPPVSADRFESLLMLERVAGGSGRLPAAPAAVVTVS